MNRRRYVKIAVEDLADLKARLTRAEMRVAELTGEIAAEDTVPNWGAGLTRAEGYLVLALESAWPRWIAVGALEDAIPAFDHTKEREANTVGVLIHRVRKKLGHAAIETKVGYRRLSDVAHARLFGGDRTPARSPAAYSPEGAGGGENHTDAPC